MSFGKISSNVKQGDQECLAKTTIFKKLYRDGSRMLNPTNPYQLKPDKPKDLNVSNIFKER